MRTISTIPETVRLVRTVRNPLPGSGAFTGWGPRVPGLALVGSDDLRLHPATRYDRAVERGGFEVADLAAFGVEPVEKPGIGDKPVFDGFGITGQQLAPR